jgi:copper homeostasis protein
MRSIIFELCAETMQACLAAREGGAHRIELCSALSEDGLTPSHGFIQAAVKQSGLPVYVLLRPRAGDSVYSDAEFALMREDLLDARALGASGFVLGILGADGTVDVERTRELVELAAPLEVTFHRAFDLTPSLDEALEDVIATGCRRLLTSGGESNVVAGSARLSGLIQRAAGRIDIAVGGGLRLDNAAFLASTTNALHFHGSVRRRVANVAGTSALARSFTTEYVVDSNDIRSVIEALREGK